jgi:hypothetical protein
VTIWTCRVCGRIADHDGPDRPPGWLLLRLCGDVRASYSGTPTLGLLCNNECLLVAAMRPFGLSENQVRAWLAGELVRS